MDTIAICSYIREHLDAPPTLDAVARRFNYSKFYFSRRFKQETGFTFKQYLEALKIERSIAHLVRDHNNATEAFINSQYESISTFSNTFKRVTGLYPQHYVKNLNRLFKLLVTATKYRHTIPYRSQRAMTGGRIDVQLHYPDVHSERVSFVGVFKTGIPNSPPIVGKAIYRHTACVLDRIPPGEYHLLITEIDLTKPLVDYFVLNQNYRAKHQGSLLIDDNFYLKFDAQMRLPQPDDPPIILNLPNLVLRAIVKNSNS